MEIAENKEFEDLGEMWLRGDHYKWRCMRTFGIDEKYITGDASYYEKYMKFAEILPQLVGNPIYIWCALELKRYFDIDEPLTAANAQEIYDRTKKLITEKHMTRRWCMEHSNVRLVSTTEDPSTTCATTRFLNEEKMFTRVDHRFAPIRPCSAPTPILLLIWQSFLLLRSSPSTALPRCSPHWKSVCSISSRSPAPPSVTTASPTSTGQITPRRGRGHLCQGTQRRQADPA